MPSIQSSENKKKTKKYVIKSNFPKGVFPNNQLNQINMKKYIYLKQLFNLCFPQTIILHSHVNHK